MSPNLSTGIENVKQLTPVALICQVILQTKLISIDFQVIWDMCKFASIYLALLAIQLFSKVMQTKELYNNTNYSSHEYINPCYEHIQCKASAFKVQFFTE